MAGRQVPDSSGQTQHHAMCMASTGNVVQQSARHESRGLPNTPCPLFASGLTLTMCPITQMTAAGEALTGAKDRMSSSHEQLKCVSQCRQRSSYARLHPSHACDQPPALRLSVPCTVQMLWPRPALLVCRQVFPNAACRPHLSCMSCLPRDAHNQ